MKKNSGRSAGGRLGLLMLGTLALALSGRSSDVQDAPTLILSATSLVFAATTSSLESQSVVTLRNSAGGSLYPTVSASTQDGGTWLTCFEDYPSTGIANLYITAKPAGLAAGVYVGTVNISAPGLLQSPQSISVTLVISTPGTLTVSSKSLSFATVLGADPAPQSLAISNSGPAGSALIWTATASNIPATPGISWMSVNPAAGSGASSLQVSVHASALPVGTYSGSVTIVSDGAQGSPVTVAGTLVVNPPPSVVSITGVVNGASFLPTITGAGWITIQGSKLASTTRTWTGADFVGNNLPTHLDDVYVTLNGQPAFVYFVSPTQLNVLAPDGLAPGPVRVQVSNNTGTSDPFTATAAAFAPGLFLFTAKYPAAVHLSGVYAGPAGLIAGVVTSPVVPNETIELFGTSFGPTDLATSAGTILTAPVPMANPVTATIGGLPAAVSFAGLASNGLVQLNVQVPAGVPTGDATLILKVAGASTPTTLSLAVQSPVQQVVQGTLDVVNSSTCSIAGWARDPQNPSPLQVRVYIDGDSTSGTFLTSFSANVLRSDLQFADQNHGFSQSLAGNPLLTDGRSHAILAFGVTAGGATGPLSGNGKLIQCSPN